MGRFEVAKGFTPTKKVWPPPLPKILERLSSLEQKALVALNIAEYLGLSSTDTEVVAGYLMRIPDRELLDIQRKIKEKEYKAEVEERYNAIELRRQQGYISLTDSITTMDHIPFEETLDVPH